MTINIQIIYEKIIKQYFGAVEIATNTEDLTPITKIHKKSYTYSLSAEQIKTGEYLGFAWHLV